LIRLSRTALVMDRDLKKDRQSAGRRFRHPA
jgi:hypothetical protein